MMYLNTQKTVWTGVDIYSAQPLLFTGIGVGGSPFSVRGATSVTKFVGITALAFVEATAGATVTMNLVYGLGGSILAHLASVSATASASGYAALYLQAADFYDATSAIFSLDLQITSDNASDTSERVVAYVGTNTVGDLNGRVDVGKFNGADVPTVEQNATAVVEAVIDQENGDQSKIITKNGKVLLTGGGRLFG